MIYRFDGEGNEEVIAEATNGRTERFLGLHYPASDIPAQTRALYLLNSVRIIADVGAKPVPIVPEPPVEFPPLDLTFAVTRAVSPVHIEYLRNMGVGGGLPLDRA